MNLKFNINGLSYMPSSKIGGGAFSNSCAPRTSRSILKMGQFFHMYEKGRKVNSPILYMLDDTISAIFRMCGLRIFENKDNKIIAGYSYKLRKNSMSEKSIYIDGIARNLSDKNSKRIMTNVYEDIKKTALDKKVKELTLFVYSSDKNLRRNYERLGFKVDEKCYVQKLYLMRVKTENFLNNAYFKLRKYKEALGIDSILMNK